MNKFLENKKKKNIFAKYSIELSVFIILIFQLMVTVSDEIYGFVTAWYVTDYSIGISSRLLIGSLVRALFGEMVSSSQVYTFLIITFVILLSLLSYVIGYTVRNAGDSIEKISLLVLAGVYLASPAAPGYLWINENMGRLDTYLYLFTLVILLVALFVKTKISRYITLGVIGVVCVLTHQVFVFLFLPLLLVILITDYFQSDFSTKILAGILAVAGIIGIVFLFFQFKSSVNYDTAEELTAVLQSRTNLPISNSTILYEYFWTIKDHFVNNMLPELRERIRFGIITVILLSPLFGIFFSIWKNAVRNAVTKKEKVEYCIILSTNLLYLPVFMLMTDWGRWFAAFITIQFLEVFYLYSKGNHSMKTSVAKFGENIRKFPGVFIMLIIYLSLFDKFEAINYLPQVETFYYTLYDLKTFVLSFF